MHIDDTIERLYDLNVGVVGVGGERHERPHKPLLLLAVLDLIDAGIATPDRIPWCDELRDNFTSRFEIVRKHDDQNNPGLPFRYLASDGFWNPVESDGQTPIRREIRVSDAGKVFARFTDGFEKVTIIPANRVKMREALIARYFPHHASALLGAPPATVPSPETPKVAEEGIQYGRSPAFRRKILEIYDHQCAACGLRIKLPAAQDISFIDAAHLIPFSSSYNDHPTNGLALCKNHHWAMDRNLIAPGPDHQWQVSKILDHRRSNGEAELLTLSKKSLLLPQDEAFHPDPEGLGWRIEQLIA
ncbi:MAG: HNH endonuclease [Luteolibacter sp.]